MNQVGVFKSIVKQETGMRSGRVARVTAIHGKVINVQAGGSARHIKHLSVVGGVSGLKVGSEVVLMEIGKKTYAQAI